MNRDSAGAKIAVVLGVGAVAVGLGMLRTRLAGPTPKPERVAVVATALPVITPSAVEPKPAPASETRPSGPTQADRVALLEACSEGDKAKVESLVLKGVNLDGTLGNAAKSGKATLVAWLIDHGVSAKEDEDLSVPPILMADEHDAVVSTLLAKGAHEPTLAKAVAVGAPRAVVRLLGKGASATSKTAEGEPVLTLALHNTTGEKRRVIVDALLKSGADVNAKSDDDTPLSVALAAVAAHSDGEAKPGDRAVDLVGKLVAKGAKVDGEALVTAMGVDDDRRAALLDLLLGGKLEPSATLRAATFAADSHDAASLKRLATKGITWSALDAHATPPLATAIFGSDVAMVTALLEAGAPVDKMGEHGDTGLLAAVAAAAGDSDEAVRVVRVLLEHGANPNKRGRDGRTALFAAAQQGTEALVTLLVAKGAHVEDAVDGMTPLEAADARGHDGVVKLLKARGAKAAVKRPAGD
jgi:cytohesin